MIIVDGQLAIIVIDFQFGEIASVHKQVPLCSLFLFLLYFLNKVCIASGG